MWHKRTAFKRRGLWCIKPQGKGLGKVLAGRAVTAIELVDDQRERRLRQRDVQPAESATQDTVRQVDHAPVPQVLKLGPVTLEAQVDAPLDPVGAADDGRNYDDEHDE